MKFKIVVDSCCDFDENKKMPAYIQSVPLTLYIEGREIVDDETFDQAAFIRDAAASPECPKSACPSPGAYMEAYEGDYDCVFVVTISSQLSGSYASAVSASQMYFEEHPDDKKQIHVFDSCSAAAGEQMVAEAIEEYALSPNASFDYVVEMVTQYRQRMKTYFVLETLDTFQKNGRLTGVQALIANVLSIKPVMGGTEDGKIVKLSQARGVEKALLKVVDIIEKDITDPEKRVMSIIHCNCRERAEWIRGEILKKVPLKDITIGDAKGVSTMYANDGGIIIAG